MQINHRTPNWTRPPLLARRQTRGALLDSARTRRAWLRRIPDLLTLSRIGLGLALLLASLVNGIANLAADVWILVLAWATDMVDGRLARMWKTAGRSWLGRGDVYVDMFLSAAALGYLVVTGLLPLAVALGYLLAWGLVFLRFGIPDLLAQTFQNPIYACFLVFTALAAPQVVPWLLLFALVAFILFRKRLFELLGNILGAVRRGVGERRAWDADQRGK